MKYILKIYGVVQGVGFRPFVYKKAMENEISGSVENIGGAVLIHCSGERDKLKCFIREVVKNPPSLASIERVQCRFVRTDVNVSDALYKDKFVIKKSSNELNHIKFISPDVAVCPKCLEDIENKGTNRYKYAFTNCTECGPRYSIIKALPYDRQQTTMNKFKMCSHCQEEYDNPLSRRFHAQPNCCDKCGPKLFLADNRGTIIRCSDPIEEAKSLLEQGKLLAIKGLGGFHLVCNGENEKAIETLRNRKRRKHKPLALMAGDIDSIKEICELSDKEEQVLLINKRPIVLLRKRTDSRLPVSIAPKQNRLGIMLPYTPLHYMLFNERLRFLVMTSGNISGRPIEYKNEEAIRHLSGVADYFLLHDREIYMPTDDSVVKVMEGEEAVSRRARGYAPYAVKIDTDKQIIALGGEQKSTVCVSKNGYANLSQYLGDLEDLNCYENFKHVLSHFSNLFDIEAEFFVHDMHPTYISTMYAKEKNIRRIEIQHHHAHMVSCMSEHSIYDSVIGIIFDGTGYGVDGAVWGGEFFIGNRNSFKRAGHLEYVNIQGGDQAVREPWRCAASYLYAMGYNPLDILKYVDKQKVNIVKQALNSKLNCFLSSSIGRFFDAAAALCGIRNTITYDGQAAIELENIIEETEECYPWTVVEKDGVLKLQYKELIEGILIDLKNNERVSKISAKFHNTLVEASFDLVSRLREKEGLNKVVLSGGVFENQYLLKRMKNTLKNKGFEVFHNKQIPINDGGISFGQLYAAVALLNGGDN
jgi:hydrogenase maturation protein HypF